MNICSVDVSGSDILQCRDAIVDRAVQRLRDDCEKVGINLSRTRVHLTVGGTNIDACIADAIKRFDNPTGPEIDMYSFPQVWASTALGFGGIGGQAMTKAQTIVIFSEWTGEVCVYFAGRFAYMISNPNEMFFERLKNHNMLERSQAHKLER